MNPKGLRSTATKLENRARRMRERANDLERDGSADKRIVACGIKSHSYALDDWATWLRRKANELQALTEREGR